MAKRKQYPVYTEGDAVRLKRDVMRCAALALVSNEQGYGPPQVYVPKGAIGTIGKPYGGHTYRVHFAEIAEDGPVALHAASLEGVG